MHYVAQAGAVNLAMFITRHTTEWIVYVLVQVSMVEGLNLSYTDRKHNTIL